MLVDKTSVEASATSAQPKITNISPNDLSRKRIDRPVMRFRRGGQMTKGTVHLEPSLKQAIDDFLGIGAVDNHTEQPAGRFIETMRKNSTRCIVITAESTLDGVETVLIIERQSLASYPCWLVDDDERSIELDLAIELLCSPENIKSTCFSISQVPLVIFRELGLNDIRNSTQLWGYI